MEAPNHYDRLRAAARALIARGGLKELTRGALLAESGLPAGMYPRLRGRLLREFPDAVGLMTPKEHLMWTAARIKAERGEGAITEKELEARTGHLRETVSRYRPVIAEAYPNAFQPQDDRPRVKRIREAARAREEDGTYEWAWLHVDELAAEFGVARLTVEIALRQLRGAGRRRPPGGRTDG